MADIQFRKKALEHIATPKALDDLIQVTTPKAWIFFYTLLFVLACALVWVFFGSIVTRVSGKGILYAEKSKNIAVHALGEGGYVTDVKVQQGSKVKKGDVVATIENFSIEKEIKTKKEYIATLEKRFEQLKEDAKKAIAEKKKNNEEKIAVLKKLIENEIAKQRKLYSLLQAEKIGLQKGVISRDRYVNSQIRYMTTIQDIDKSKNDILELELSLKNFIDTWEERIRNLELKIQEEKYNLSTLLAKNRLSRKVISPTDGFIKAMQIKPGDYVSRDKVLFTIATDDQGLEAYAFVNAREGKKISPGMKAQVEPSNIKKLEFGDIKGKVIEVSSFPITPEELQSILKNKNLVDEFLSQGPIIEVQIALQRDPNTFSGYAWTSSKGPQQKITAGTLVTAKITVRKQSPISLFIPRIIGR